MKVELNKQGLFVLTAETKQDNMVLFSITNNENITGIQLRYGKEPVTVDIGKKKETKEPKQKRKTYFKECPVEGCGERTKGLKIHMRMKHGVWDGQVHEKFLFHGKESMPISKPVVQLPDGTYRVRPVPSLLD